MPITIIIIPVTWTPFILSLRKAQEAIDKKVKPKAAKTGYPIFTCITSHALEKRNTLKT